jgi:hypothetical protein
MIIYVFMGPTLSAKEARAELEAVYLPPVSQGDVYRVGLLRPAAIGIIDGYFHRVPSVWHKEILWAMAQGIHVYGSASMGALRAAELAPFGMEGVGQIFEAYRDGVMEDDDEVAVTHGPPETGYACLSVAMVNIRKTLAQAQLEGIITEATRAAIEQLAKNLFFPERTYSLILREAAAEGLPAAELQALQSWLPAGEIDQKRQDALAMLRRMRDELSATIEHKRVNYKLEHTVFWDDLMAWAGRAEGQVGRQTMLTTDAVLDELRLRGIIYVQAREQALLRDLALRAAQYRGHRTDHAVIEKKRAEFRQLHGLHQPDDLDRWLQDNHLDHSGLEGLIEQEAVLAGVLKDRHPGWERIIDHLRATGEYAELRSRALDKQHQLEVCGLSCPSLQTVGITREALLDWYFRQLGPFFVPDPKHHSQSMGFANLEAFVLAVLREFCYMRLKNNDGQRAVGQ